MWQDDVFQVERYEILIEVRPTPKEEIRVRHGSKLRVVRFDHRTEIRRAVRFARSNACYDRFALCYATRGEGFIYPPVHLPVLNEASPAELGRYHDHGKEITWRFPPHPGSTFSQSFKILGGFSPGDRNAHFHLHNKTRYETVVVSLDLRPYVEEEMLQDGVFFGSTILLFEREPGRASIPTPAARAAVQMIRRYLAGSDYS